jgi:hypothetical protein
MKYTCIIEIDRPIDEVVSKFDNPDNLDKWMEGLQSMELISGEAGQPGAKSKMIFLHKNREMELIETILVRNLPDEFTGTYESSMSMSTNTNRFESIDSGRTRMTMDAEFKFNGFMKFLAFLMPGAFKKQSMKYLTAFKAMVEST